MLTHALALAVLALFLPALSGHGQEKKKGDPKKPDPQKVKELMHRKLVSSQKLLEALTTNNLPAAGKQAEELTRISKEAEWKVLKTERYEMWSDEFRRSADGIAKAARDRNLESAKLNYLGMVLVCFNCHAYTRDQGVLHEDPVARQGNPNPQDLPSVARSEGRP